MQTLNLKKKLECLLFAKAIVSYCQRQQRSFLHWVFSPLRLFHPSTYGLADYSSPFSVLSPSDRLLEFSCNRRKSTKSFASPDHSPYPCEESSPCASVQFCFEEREKKVQDCIAILKYLELKSAPNTNSSSYSLMQFSAGLEINRFDLLFPNSG